MNPTDCPLCHAPMKESENKPDGITVWTCTQDGYLMTFNPRSELSRLEQMQRKLQDENKRDRE